MQRWEYMVWDAATLTPSSAKILRINGKRVETGASFYDGLEQAGEDGWELVNAVRAGEARHFTFLFKRPKVEG